MSLTSTQAASLAESARTVEEMIQAARALGDSIDLEAIPSLARLDRRAKGWLFSFAGWLAVALATLLILACLLIFWIGLWGLGLTTLTRLVNQLHPNWGLWVAVAAVALAAAVLYHDPRLHELVEERMALDMPGLARPLRWSLQGARGLVYLLVVLIAGGLLAVVSVVMVLTILDWGTWLVDQVRRPGGLLIYFFGQRWLVGLSTILFVTLAALGLRSLRKHGILVAVGFLVGAWGLLRLILATNTLWTGREWFTVGVVVGAAALYPSKIPFLVAQPMTLPLHWLNANAHLLAKRLQLRKLLWSAVRHHRRQNVSRTGKKWKLALCSNCLARFERRQERLAYRRRFQYAWCRRCHSDQACYQGVHQAQGWLDQGLSTQQEQVGDAVRVNLLTYLSDQNRPLPLDLDLIVVGEATDHQVEAFLTLYQERGRQQPLRPFSKLSYRLEANASIGPNVRAMLHNTFAQQEEE